MPLAFVILNFGKRRQFKVLNNSYNSFHFFRKYDDTIVFTDPFYV